MSLFNKDFILAIFVRCFGSAVFMLLNVVVAAYVIYAYQEDTSLAGVAAGVFIFASLIVRPFIGRFEYKIGRKRLLLIGSFASFAVCCIHLLPLDITTFIIMRFIHGLATGAASNAINTISVELVPPDHMGEGLGYNSLGATVASACAPLIGVPLLQSGNYFLMFGFCALMALTSGVLALPMKVPELDEAGYQEAASAKLTLDSFISKASVPASATVCLLAMGISCISSYQEPFCQSCNMGYLASWYFFTFAITMTVSRIILAKVQDTYGDNAIAIPGIILMIIGFFVLSLGNPIALFAAALINGVGYGMLFPGFQAIAVRSVPSTQRGTATATYYVFTDAGLGFGAMVGGLIIPLVGYSGVFVVCSIIAALDFAFYWFIHGRKAGMPKKRESAE